MKRHEVWAKQWLTSNAPLVVLFLTVGAALSARGAWQTTKVRLHCIRAAEPVLSCNYVCYRAFGLIVERSRLTGITRVTRARVPSGRSSSRPALALWNRDDPIETIVGEKPAVEHALAELERLLALPDTQTMVTMEEHSTFQLGLGGLILVLGLIAWLAPRVPRQPTSGSAT